MRLLYFLADTFINTFGITRPTEKTRRQAAFFILAMGIAVITVVVVTGLLLHGLIH